MDDKKVELSKIFDKFPVGFLFYNKEGNLTDLNQAALEILGINSYGDCNGFNLFDNQDIASLKDDLLNFKLIRFQSTMEINGIGKSETALIDYIVSVTDSGFLVQIVDITKNGDYLTLKEPFGDSNDPFSFINGGVILYSSSADIIRMNMKALEMLGLSLSDLDLEDFKQRRSKVGTCKSDGTPLDIEEAPHYRATHGETIVGEEIIFKLSDRESLLVSTTATPIFNIDGEISGAIAIFTEISKE